MSSETEQQTMKPKTTQLKTNATELEANRWRLQATTCYPFDKKTVVAMFEDALKAHELQAELEELRGEQSEPER